jgi:hypothetical protein
MNRRFGVKILETAAILSNFPQNDPFGTRVALSLASNRFPQPIDTASVDHSPVPTLARPTDLGCRFPQTAARLPQV